MVLDRDHFIRLLERELPPIVPFRVEGTGEEFIYHSDKPVYLFTKFTSRASAIANVPTYPIPRVPMNLFDDIANMTDEEVARYPLQVHYSIKPIDVGCKRAFLKERLDDKNEAPYGIYGQYRTFNYAGTLDPVDFDPPYFVCSISNNKDLA